MANAQISQSVVEMISLGNPHAQVSQSIIELISGVGIACGNPPLGTVGVVYTATFPVSGGPSPTNVFSIISGSLPPGLTLNSASGIVSGTPTMAGVFSFTIQVTNLGETASVACSIIIQAPAILVHPAATSGGASLLRICQAPNFYDATMREETLRLRKIKFPPICAIPPEYLNSLPWDDTFGAIPPGAVPFRAVAGIVTPAPAAGNVQVVEYQMPNGYDGLLTALFHFYNGQGFKQGSGDIVWRLQLNQRFVRDLGSMPYALGSPQEPIPLTQGQIVDSISTLRYLVDVPNLSGLIQVGASTIVCGLIGFMWAR